jgi:uncharacterized protein YdeI (BOF family)
MGTFSRVSPHVAVEQPVMREEGKNSMSVKKLVAFGVALALIPAALFATVGTVSAQTPTATAAKAATVAAPKSGSGGFLGQESNSNTMTIVLLVAAAASVAVAGRMVTRRR